MIIASASPTKPKDLILRLLNEHRVMALATNRSDGWPQVTMVGYVNDGFLLYSFIAANSQKYANIRIDPRVAVAIGSDAPSPMDVKGLSLAGKASIVTDPAELDYVSRLRLERYPEYADLPPPVLRDAAGRISPQPSPNAVALLQIAPEMFSVLDYSRGFGHSDLIAFSERDLDRHIESRRHYWNGAAVR